MDGQFVPSKSIIASDIANLTIKTNWEAHLMVKHPLSQLDDFRKAGQAGLFFIMNARFAFRSNFGSQK